MPLYTVAFELAVEQTASDGVGETMSCGLINIINQVFGFLICISLTPTLDKKTHKSAMIKFMVLLAINVISQFAYCLSCVVVDLVRMLMLSTKLVRLLRHPMENVSYT